MAKTVSMNEITYAQVVALAATLMQMSKRPISLSLAIHLAVNNVLNSLQDKKFYKETEKALSNSDVKWEDLKSFDEVLETMYRAVTKT